MFFYKYIMIEKSRLFLMLPRSLRYYLCEQNRKIERILLSSRKLFIIYLLFKEIKPTAVSPRLIILP
jgi:hypothetical protein